jgi:sialate O-acetylesterase
VAPWSGDRKAAISLTFDDALLTHLEIVGPLLKKHHLNGTFFVATGNERWRNHLDAWRQLAREGNEIGNHTVTHPCLLSRIEPHSQEFTPEMMEGEVRDAAHEITMQIGSQRGLTFAYPCGNISFGPIAQQVNNAALYLRYVADHSFAARAYSANSPQNPDGLSVLTITDLGETEGKDFPALLAMAAPALREGFWGIYCFHGVGGDWLSTPVDALDELAGFLEKHSEIWSAPFGDVVRYIQERKAVKAILLQSDQQKIEANLSWPLDPHIYDLPLTFKITLPDRWTNPKVIGNEKFLLFRLLEGKDTTTLLVDVSPQTSHLSVFKQ